MAEVLRFDIFARDQFSKSFKKLTNMLPSVKQLALGAAAGVAATGTALFAMAKTTATAYDKLGKFSNQTGLSVEFLSKMKVAANFADVNLNTMNKSLERLQIGIGEAGKGIGLAKDTLADMGIELHQANGKMHTAESILPLLADRFQNMTDATQRSEAAQKLFGQRGIEMLKILKDGSAGLKEYSDEATALGLVIDKKAAANAAKFNDVLYKVQAVLTGLKNEIGEKVMPIITGLAEKFSDFVKNNRARIINFGETVITTMAGIVEKMAYGVGLIIDSWRGLQMTWEVLKIGLNELAKFFTMSIDFIIEKMVGLMEAINFRGIFDEEIDRAKNWSNNMKMGIETLQESADAARDNLQSLVNEGAATQKIDAFISKAHEAIENIRELGEAEIENRQLTNEAINIVQEEQNQKEKDDYQAHLDELLMMHDEYFLSDQQKLDNWFAETQSKHSHNANALSKLNQIYAKKKADIDKQNADLSKQLAQEEFQAKVSTLSNIASIGRTFGKQFFGFTRAAGIAEAIINTHASAVQAFNRAGGFPWGIPAAAASIAYGFARVSSIRQQTFAHGGLENIAREQNVTVEAGERILSREQNKDITDFIKKDQRGNVTIENMNILPNATNANALLDMTRVDWEEITEANILPALRRLNDRGLIIA